MFKEESMPRPQMTEQEREAFLAEPRIGVLSVANRDGRPPLTVPLWYNYQPGGNITFFTGTAGRKARKTDLINRAGVVSFCAQQSDMPYKYVTVEGTVVGVDQPPSTEDMLAIVRRYLPEETAQGFVQAELANTRGTLVLFTIRPDRWLSADFSGE
jgi:nitroimidazol reductase NimA-like FMN-containing flavoprotein (pyridoxamine 5'-phosphate oxidase superfamily)